MRRRGREEHEVLEEQSASMASKEWTEESGFQNVGMGRWGPDQAEWQKSGTVV